MASTAAASVALEYYCCMRKRRVVLQDKAYMLSDILYTVRMSITSALKIGAKEFW